MIRGLRESRANGVTGCVFTAAFVLLMMASSMAVNAQTTIEFIYLAGAEATEATYRALTEAFEAANPTIRVERLRITSGYADRLTALIASGTVPDVISLDMNFIMSFGDERFLYDLLPLIEKTPGYEPELVAKPMLDVFTVDGKLFAAPYSANPSAYVYNEDLFNQSGLATPNVAYAEDAWTWDAFRETARKLTRMNPNGQFDVIGASMHLPRTWIFSNGGREFDDTHRPTRTYYDSPESLEALNFLYELMFQDNSIRWFADMPGAVGADDIVGFTQGKIGMSTRWLSSVPAFSEGGQRIGLVPYPKGPAPGGRYATDLGMFGISISKQTEHLDASWQFVSFLTGPEGARLAGRSAGATPSRPAELPWLSDLVINPEVYPELLIHGTIRLLSENRVDINRIIDNQLREVWRNTVSVESAVAEIVRQVDSYLQGNNEQ